MRCPKVYRPKWRPRAGQRSHKVGEVGVGDGVAKAAGRDENLRAAIRSGDWRYAPFQMCPRRTRGSSAATLPLRARPCVGSSSRASSNSSKPGQRRPSAGRSDRRSGIGPPPRQPARSVMCRTLGGANPSSKRQRTVSSMTAAGAFGASLGAGGRPAGRGHGISGLPQNAPNVVGRPQIMGGQIPLGARHTARRR